jgi:hypothetical protein
LVSDAETVKVHNSGDGVDSLDRATQARATLFLRRISDRSRTLSRSSVFELAYYVLLPVFPAGCGLWSIYVGQDVNFDYFNYHSYDAWAFLQGRTFSDVFPGGTQSLVSPILDVPTFLLENHLAPKLAAFLIGAYQGLGPLLVVLIVAKMTKSRSMALLGGATAAVAGGFASELGNDMGDSLVAPFFLLGVLFALVALERNQSSSYVVDDSAESRRLSPAWRVTCWWVAAGVAVGIGGGLKYAELPVMVGVVVSSTFVLRGVIGRVRIVIATTLGAIVGLAITSGYWTIELWQHYDDPFAFIGGTLLGFGDPYAFGTGGGSGTQTSLVSHFSFLWAPITAFFHPTDYAELPVKEGSLAIAAGLLFVVAAVLVVRYLVVIPFSLRASRVARPFRRSTAWTPAERVDASFDRMMIVTFVVAIYLWTHFLNIYRYLIPLELLGIVIVIALGRRMIGSVSDQDLRRQLTTKVLVPVFVVICVICMLTESPSAYWDRVGFSGTWASLQTPTMLENGKLDALVGVGEFGYPDSFELPLLKGHFIAIGGVDGSAAVNLLTPATQKLLDAAFARVRNAHGSVIGFWRNTPATIGPLGVINSLDPQKMRMGPCVQEIGTVGASLQLYEFCQFLPLH